MNDGVCFVCLFVFVKPRPVLFFILWDTIETAFEDKTAKAVSRSPITEPCSEQEKKERARVDELFDTNDGWM